LASRISSFPAKPILAIRQNETRRKNLEAASASPRLVGLTTDIKDGKRWQRELIFKQTPLLLPCMTPNGPDLITALICIADVLGNGNHTENMAHYES
jgi:hypothetical protein